MCMLLSAHLCVCAFMVFKCVYACAFTCLYAPAYAYMLLSVYSCLYVFVHLLFSLLVYDYSAYIKFAYIVLSLLLV